MSLQTRFFLNVMGYTALAFIAATILITYYATKQTEQTINNEIKNLTQSYKNKVEGELKSDLQIARTMAQSSITIKNLPPKMRRPYFNSLLKSLLEKNRDLLCTWTAWEPNAFDGLDKEFVNTEGTDATGRFIPAWNRSLGTIAVNPNLDYDKPGAGAYYLIPKETMKEYVSTVLYSYTGKKEDEIILNSLCIPIIIDSKFVGVIGIDQSLAFFQKIIGGIKPYDTGYAMLLANNGMRLAHPKKELLGVTFGDDLGENQQAYLDSVKTGKSFTIIKTSKETGKQTKFFFEPIVIGESNTPWSIGVAIPIEIISERVARLRNLMILISLISLFILGIITYLISRNFSISIKQILKQTGQIIDAVLKGDLKFRGKTENLHHEFHPVIEGFNKALDAVIEPLNVAANYVEKISKGDIPEKITDEYKGDFNTIKNNLNQCIDALTGLTNEMGETTKMQIAGDIEVFASRVMQGSFTPTFSRNRA